MGNGSSEKSRERRTSAWGQATVDRDTGRHGDDGGAHARTFGGLANHAGNGAARRKGELEESAVE